MGIGNGLLVVASDETAAPSRFGFQVLRDRCSSSSGTVEECGVRACTRSSPDCGGTRWQGVDSCPKTFVGRRAARPALQIAGGARPISCGGVGEVANLADHQFPVWKLWDDGEPAGSSV